MNNGTTRRTIQALTLALLSTLLIGCALLPWAKTANDIAKEECAKALGARAEVDAAAVKFGYSRDFWVEVLCKAPDIIDIFLTQNKSGSAQESKADRAVRVAQAKGLI